MSFVYREDAGPIFDYLTNKEIKQLKQWLQGRRYEGILANKLSFHRHFDGSGLPLPRFLAHNTDRTFYIKEEERSVGHCRAFCDLIEVLRARSSNGSIFIKPIDGGKGEGCYRIDEGADPAALYERIVSGCFLFEETLAQHEAISAIYPHSINTVRVLTCVTDGGAGRPAAVAALLRMGTGKSHVDNASQGGIFVGADLATGRLLPLAKQFLEHGGRVWATHPDTGFRFAGFELPQFEAVLDRAVAAAAHLPHEVVGWDFAITENGPVLIEGNERPHLPLVEIATGRGLWTHPPFRAICESLRLRRAAPSRRLDGPVPGQVVGHGQ